MVLDSVRCLGECSNGINPGSLGFHDERRRRRARLRCQRLRNVFAASALVGERTQESWVERCASPVDDVDERSWGASEEKRACARAMRAQWLYSYTSTPKGYKRATHGFGEVLAGMQAAACDAMFDALPGASVLDPFAGGGTTLVVGQMKGKRAIGVDVSPYSAFVARHRTWRANANELGALRDVARNAAERAKANALELDSASERAVDVTIGDRDEESDGGKEHTTSGEVLAGDSGTPRAWRPMRDALRGILSSETRDGRVVEAAWFCLSVAAQRTQKARNKRRPKGKGRKMASANVASENADAFVKVTDEYVDRVMEFQSECERVAPAVPEASIFNMDIRNFKLKEEDKVDAVLTSCVYPGVYDYQSFARKVRAGSGAVVASDDGKSHQAFSSTFLTTTVPEDRHWPKEWLEGEIGSRKALRSDPYAFKEVWQRDTDAWLAVVADCLKPGGRAAIMVGDGANIDTRASIVDAGAKVGLIELAGCTLRRLGTLGDGVTVYNQARTEHLLLLEKPRSSVE